MSTVKKIGSALKRAALYVPRKINSGYQRVKMGIKPGDPNPIKYLSLLNPLSWPAEIHSYLHTRAWRKAMKTGIVHIEDEHIGPFASTVVARPKTVRLDGITEDASGAREKKPLTLENEQVGPFPSTIIQRRNFIASFVRKGTKALRIGSYVTIGATSLLFLSGLLTPLAAVLALTSACSLQIMTNRTEGNPLSKMDKARLFSGKLAGGAIIAKELYEAYITQKMYHLILSQTLNELVIGLSVVALSFKQSQNILNQIQNNKIRTALEITPFAIAYAYLLRMCGIL